MRSHRLSTSLDFSRITRFPQGHVFHRVPSLFVFGASWASHPHIPHLVRNDVGMLISQALGHFAAGQEIAGLVGQHGSAHIQHANVLRMEDKGSIYMGFYPEIVI